MAKKQVQVQASITVIKCDRCKIQQDPATFLPVMRTISDGSQDADLCPDCFQAVRSFILAGVP